MAQYLVTYCHGDSETITADNLELSGNQYIGWAGDGSAVAYIPSGNVLSIIRLNDEAVTD
ncbi:hypothetical protein ACFXAS_05755 [Streptomyces sp. NPDC059459]